MMPQWLPSDEASGQPTQQKKTKKKKTTANTNSQAVGVLLGGRRNNNNNNHHHNNRFSFFAGRSSAKNDKKEKRQQISLAAGGATVSDEAYMQINLQDLESYTNQILDSERSRRRQLICKVVLSLAVATVVIVGGYQKLTQRAARHKHHHHPKIDYSKYPLTQCEKTLLQHNNNMSFFDLVQAFEDDAQVVLDDHSLHCRPSHPNCDWKNPTVPATRLGLPAEMKDWKAATAANLATIQHVLDSDSELDVVLIGDSLVEHMEGKELGKEQTSLKRDEDVFETLFTRQGGGTIDGLALGIGGDRSTNLLWRLQNGELNFNFRPKVWWIIIGTRDWELGLAPESVVAGVIRVVQEIRDIHPEASVVINSLLPHQQDKQRSIQQVNQMLGCYVHAQSLIDEDKMREKEETRVHIEQNLQTNTTTTKRGSKKHHHHHRLLHFFNATNIFMEQHSDGSYALNSAYMMMVGANRNSPAAHGEWMWGEKIVDTVHQLVSQQEQEQQAAAGQGTSSSNKRTKKYGGHKRRRHHHHRRRLHQQQTSPVGFMQSSSSSLFSSFMEWLQ